MLCVNVWLASCMSFACVRACMQVDNRSNQEFRDVRLEVERRLTLVSNSAGGGGSAGSSGSGSSSATAGLVPGCFTEEERIFKSKTTGAFIHVCCFHVCFYLPGSNVSSPCVLTRTHAAGLQKPQR